jgi:hypothetical protein
MQRVHGRSGRGSQVQASGEVEVAAAWYLRTAVIGTEDGLVSIVIPSLR